ncbi:basic proline-rich protein-like [Sceloporus undulatus]|uniref:basic proline-rich protein-like n=1 Tax=Sceloporus undulatus TaxID=8520 RepID=UPI001C4D096E|nr:basic proline-rich protein-like [Sceloporus undulatus]
MSQPSLGLLLCLVLVIEGTTGSFFKPLTCRQDIAERKKCGAEAEKFYPNECLKKKCCYRNNTCYHHVIDGPRQRRNAGIIGGTSVIFFILSVCLFYRCKLKELQRKERESETLRSEGETADYLVKLLDEESEPDHYRRPESLDLGYSWAPGRPGWSPDTMYSPGMSPQQSPGPMEKLPGPRPMLLEAPPAAPLPAPALGPAPPPALAPTPGPTPAPGPPAAPAPAPGPGTAAPAPAAPAPPAVPTPPPPAPAPGAPPPGAAAAPPPGPPAPPPPAPGPPGASPPDKPPAAPPGPTPAPPGPTPAPPGPTPAPPGPTPAPPGPTPAPPGQPPPKP